MTPDPKWLEILKASGWQTTALATACGLFLLVDQIGWLPPLAPWIIQGAAFGLLVFACLSLASIGSAALRLFPDTNRGQGDGEPGNELTAPASVANRRARSVIAAAGFSPTELDVTVHENTVLVTGKATA